MKNNFYRKKRTGKISDFSVMAKNIMQIFLKCAGKKTKAEKAEKNWSGRPNFFAVIPLLNLQISEDLKIFSDSHKE